VTGPPGRGARGRGPGRLLAAAGLALGLGSEALAGSLLARPPVGLRPPGPVVPLERRPVTIRPVYPAPPAGTLVLPVAPPPIAPPAPGATGRSRWAPARVQVRVGIPPGGGIVHFLEETPGRFER
jgi:hypothetical protein